MKCSFIWESGQPGHPDILKGQTKKIVFIYKQINKVEAIMSCFLKSFQKILITRGDLKT